MFGLSLVFWCFYFGVGGKLCFSSGCLGFFGSFGLSIFFLFCFFVPFFVEWMGLVLIFWSLLFRAHTRGKND